MSTETIKSISNLKKQSIFFVIWKRNRIALLFLSPWLLGLAVFTAMPMITSFYMSFTSYDMFTTPKWVGMSNYTSMFDDIRFQKSMKVSFTYVFIGVPLQLIFALMLALLLNRGIKGLSFFRAVYYIPSLLGGSVGIAILWRQVYGKEGIFNDLIILLGVEPKSWVTDPSTSLYTLITLLIWQFGSPMIIFLAGLKQIPSELYESASIDGAGAVRKFTKITFPLLTPIVLFNLVMQVISAFQAFTPAFIVGGSNGGALDSTLFYTLYLYIQAFNQFRMGYASAMAWVLLLIIASLTALLFLSAKRWVHYES